MVEPKFHNSVKFIDLNQTIGGINLMSGWEILIAIAIIYFIAQ